MTRSSSWNVGYSMLDDGSTRLELVLVPAWEMEEEEEEEQ